MEEIDNVLNKVITIENCEGDSIMSFEIDKNGKIIRFENCDIADEDIDYIFGTDKVIIRIQQEE